MRIALDAMGGDHGVRPNVAGALKAIACVPDLTVVLVGDPELIEPTLAASTYPAERIEIVASAGVIGMDEKPVEALRRNPDNSISRCWQLTATKKTDGLVSAGNTGAVVGAGLFARRFLKGVRRPGIGTLMPTAKGSCVILDVGANIFPKPSHLLQYAVMGSVLAKHRLGVEHPKIGLMNVGEEEGKGHELAQKTYALFRNSPFADRFIGNVEGRDVHKGAVDVIITDGFVGNVLLKHAEGVFEFIMSLVTRDVVGALSVEKAIAAEASDYEIVSIPGLPNRPPKEVSLKNLAYIIEARMSEIMELVYAEIYRMGLHDKLSAGIVLTGGGSQLQNLEQLTEYITGLDTRIGYPNQHLGKSRIEAVKSPMYATTVGLVLSGYHSLDERNARAPYEREEQFAVPAAYYAPQPVVVATPAPTETRASVPAVPAPAAAPAKPKEPGAASRFFKDIITRTKGLLIDDYDDKSY